MSDEISIRLVAKLTNGNHQESFLPGIKKFDQTTVGSAGGVVIVGTAEEDLEYDDVVTPGYLFIQHVDPAGGIVTYGPKNGSGDMEAIGRLETEGEYSFIRLDPTAVFRWQASSASVKVYYLLLAD